MNAALGVALLLIVGQPVNDLAGDDTTFSERQPVRLEPVPAQHAFAAFRDICMAHFPDPAAFDAAAAASNLGFVRSDRPERGTQEWNSRHGQILLQQAGNRGRETRRDRREGHASRRRWLERCEYWVAISEPMETPALVAAIGAQLAPRSRPVEEIVGFSWEIESTTPGSTMKLVYLPSDDDPRLFTLSLQRLADNPTR